MPGEAKSCFVASPIGDEGTDVRRHADWLFDGIVLPVFQEHFPQFTVERADKIASPGMINSQVINRLFEVDLVIADMSKHNANAFYEMAIRHMTRKPIIHVYQKSESIPFDVAPHRAVPFAYLEWNDVEKARALLKDAIEEATKDGFAVENPVTHARGRFELEQSASPVMKVLANDLAALRGRLDLIDQERRRDETLRKAASVMFANTSPRSSSGALYRFVDSSPTILSGISTELNEIDEDTGSKKTDNDDKS